MKTKRSQNTFRNEAALFSALGDKTRLSLVSSLIDGNPHSISQLQEGFKISRQAITKHLRILEDVGLVTSVRVGRESQFELDPKAIEDGKRFLDLISKQWDHALLRLKSFVEDSK